ncbi:3-keto-L-gulonate-6-phosphate decarboxylase SgbH [Vibrio aerogenes CECT 7868]|uniref:3-keto-L-gulonate-6-phosphate decarboxylase SgbH n=1 Tax=Vibrio aerogenes CECT 7868 TaxID=1216006 RepID=A0A1M5YC14_9VIBR|nr:3-keto-L-gulonate-6-phosphate decarboxylase UlaD [Vibrio aerogenes]SHI09631.1 3-keto-L-gulonate-6-phosphate decarboxylase SgbH [Vibrio aerogenes CECT 7868]
MKKPLLQLALDSSGLETALLHASRVADHVDVIEAGTVLAFAQGMNAVRELRARYPSHRLVCDMKLLDAGEVLAAGAFSAGADWITVGAAAHIETISAAHRVATQMGGEVQIELFGHWTLEDARLWIRHGINQVIYHRSRDAQAAGVCWGEKDLTLMKALSDLGMRVSVTGGIVPDDVHLFREIDVQAFIAGRALTGDNGVQMAEAFHAAIERDWQE